MFRLILERNFLRLMFCLAVVSFIGVFVYAYRIELRNKPPENLKIDTLSGARAVVEGVEQVPLAVQNYASGELSRRLQEIVAETLTFTASTFISNSAAAEKYFAPSGYQQYKNFLATAGFETYLHSQNLRSGAYTETQPVELAHGVYDDIYKWVFEVPVTISFMQANADTYRDGEITPTNRRFMLRVQFARVKDPTDPNAVKIELWQVLPARTTL